MTDRIALDGWNDWELAPKTPALIYMGPRNLDYGIDLDRMLTRDAFAWWVLQVHGKHLGADAEQGLIEAVDAVLDMQAVKEYTPESIRQRVAAFVADPDI